MIPIYCTGACDVCRDYARELGVPLIIESPPLPAEPPASDPSSTNPAYALAHMNDAEPPASETVDAEERHDGAIWKVKAKARAAALDEARAAIHNYTDGDPDLSDMADAAIDALRERSE